MYILYNRFLIFCLFFLLLQSCSSINNSILKDLTAENGFSGKKEFKAEISIIIKKAENFNPDNDFEADFWISEITDHQNQRISNIEFLENPPQNTIIEKENGNTIHFWNLTDKILKSDSVVIKRIISGSLYNYMPQIDPKIVTELWNEIPPETMKFYTKEEEFLEQTNEIKALAAKIAGNETNKYKCAKLIFNYLRQNMTYVYPPKKRGAIEACETLKGDCGQYSALFIALARSIGIPARQQSGFNFTLEKTGYHVWSEIYLPKYGWVPVDATRDNGFGRIGNDVIIASVGMNIPLQNAPEWANYSNSEIENGRTSFMQVLTSAYKSGELNISTIRRVLELK